MLENWVMSVRAFRYEVLPHCSAPFYLNSLPSCQSTPMPIWMPWWKLSVNCSLTSRKIFGSKEAWKDRNENWEHTQTGSIKRQNNYSKPKRTQITCHLRAPRWRRRCSDKSKWPLVSKPNTLRKTKSTTKAAIPNNVVTHCNITYWTSTTDKATC